MHEYRTELLCGKGGVSAPSSPPFGNSHLLPILVQVSHLHSIRPLPTPRVPIGILWRALWRERTLLLPVALPQLLDTDISNIHGCTPAPAPASRSRTITCRFVLIHARRREAGKLLPQPNPARLLRKIHKDIAVIIKPDNQPDTVAGHLSPAILGCRDPPLDRHTAAHLQPSALARSHPAGCCGVVVGAGALLHVLVVSCIVAVIGGHLSRRALAALQF